MGAGLTMLCMLCAALPGRLSEAPAAGETIRVRVRVGDVNREVRPFSDLEVCCVGRLLPSELPGSNAALLC